MYPDRHVELLGLGEEHIVIGMRMRLAGHHELRDPSAFTSGFHRALQLDRRCGRSPSDRCATGISLPPLSLQKSTM